MPNHQVLDNVTHKDLRVHTEHHPRYGDTASYVNVFTIEFRDVQNQYPMFFRKNSHTAEFEAIALFGFDQDENLLLDESGWHASYIPLAIQRRPFLIGFQETVQHGLVEKEPVVHVDMDSPRICKEDEAGEPVFMQQGGQTEYLQHISSILHTVHNGHQDTRQFINMLLELDLIESVEISVTLNDNTQHKLGHLYTISEEKLSELDGDSLSKLHKFGYLQGIYMMLASLSNLTRLIEFKNQKLNLA